MNKAGYALILLVLANISTFYFFLNRDRPSTSLENPVCENRRGNRQVEGPAPVDRLDEEQEREQQLRKQQEKKVEGEEEKELQYPPHEHKAPPNWSPPKEQQQQHQIVNGSAGGFVSFLPSVQSVLDEFDWTEYDNFYEQHKNDGTPIRLPTHLIERYSELLTPYLELAPSVPIELSRRPVPLSSILSCSNYPALTGEKRKKPVKIFDFVPFFVELDLLEIRLYELNDTVDYFIILESTLTHRATKKPLFYARNRERFAPFWDKIIHLVMDDSDILANREASQVGKDYWHIENLARTVIWNKFIQSFRHLVSPDDWLLHGDMDEIPSGKLLYHLKHCQTKGRAYRLKLYDYAFNFRWTGRREGLRFPQLWRPEQMTDSGFCRGGDEKCPNDGEIGYEGMHMTYYGKPEYLMFKNLALAEGGAIPRNDMRLMKSVAAVEEETVRAHRICCNPKTEPFVHPEDVPHLPKPIWIPWFVEANKKRFPVLFPTRTIKDY